MLETICQICGKRYAPSTEHVCEKPAAKKPRITAGPRAPDTGVAGPELVCRVPGQENGAKNNGRKPKKSTAARKDVRMTMEEAGSDQQHAVGGKSDEHATVAPSTSGNSASALVSIDVAAASVKAGTQALPVDTIPKPKMGRPRLLNPTSKRADYQRDLMVRMRRDYPEKYGPKRKGTT